MGRTEVVDSSNSSRKFCDLIAHELANPLNGMLGSVEVVERHLAAQVRGENGISDLLAILRKEITRLTLLLKELRSSRVLLDINLEPTSLSTEVRELLALESAYCEQRRIRIHQDVPSDLPFIMADRNKLRQILLNLYKNAVEAMADGGTLTLRGYTSEACVCLDIKDTGNGIPEAMRVFEPAVTNKPQGTGLGLLIVREIVEQHNGTVAYTTRRGKGTSFHLRFPAGVR